MKWRLKDGGSLSIWQTESKVVLLTMLSVCQCHLYFCDLLCPAKYLGQNFYQKWKKRKKKQKTNNKVTSSLDIHCKQPENVPVTSGTDASKLLTDYPLPK